MILEIVSIILFSSPTAPMAHHSPRSAILGFASANLAKSQGTASQPPKPSVASRTPQKPAVQSDPDLIPVDLNCSDTPLHTIVGLIMDEAKINVILISPGDTKLTLRFKARPLALALHDVCAAAGISYLKVGTEYVLGSEDKLKASYTEAWMAAHPEAPKAQNTSDPQNETIIEVYETSFVDANKLSEAMKKVFPEGSGVAVLPGVPLETPSLTNLNTSDKTGVSANVLQRDTVAAAVTRRLVISGPRRLVKQALDMARMLDVGRPQVNIKVTIDDISNDALRNLGIEWSSSINSTANESQGKGINFGAFTRTPISLMATLQALETSNQAKLLASPSISLMDGEQGNILDGQRLTFPIVIGLNSQGQPIFDTREERVGIFMQVGVWVTREGKIKLRLYPQVSTVTGFITVNGGQYPQIATREAQTVLTAESGQPIVIGGLMRSEEIVDKQAVPILSRIPIIGELFIRRKVTHSNSQLVITITPTLLPTKQ